MTSEKCQPNGPHLLVGGKRCVCGATEGIVGLTWSQYDALTAQLAASRASEERLKGVLEWYADRDNYEDGVPGERLTHPPYARCGGCDDGFEEDNGERARAALTAAAAPPDAAPRGEG